MSFGTGAMRPVFVATVADSAAVDLRILALENKFHLAGIKKQLNARRGIVIESLERNASSLATQGRALSL